MSHPPTHPQPLDTRTPPPNSIPYSTRYRSPPDKSPAHMKRPSYHVGAESAHRDMDEGVHGSKRIRSHPHPPHNATSSNILSHDELFKTFSVDFFEITDDLVTIKVRLNDERYEGVLKCC